MDDGIAERIATALERIADEIEDPGRAERQFQAELRHQARLEADLREYKRQAKGFASGGSRV